ncbi:MAG: hypothetical protein ABIY55_27675 [Kofleriaceae bacterium]
MIDSLDGFKPPLNDLEIANGGGAPKIEFVLSTASEAASPATPRCGPRSCFNRALPSDEQSPPRAPAGNSAAQAPGLHSMRALLAMVLVVVVAISRPEAAEPAAGSAATAAPSTISELDHGGEIVVPRPAADARRYPRGMVIEPPDVGDRMVLITGPWAWDIHSLVERVQRVFTATWSALQPVRM